MMRGLSLFLVLLMLLSVPAPVLAEEKDDDSGFLGSAKNLFGNLAESAGDAAGSAWDATSSWAQDTWSAAGGVFTNAADWADAFFSEQGSKINDKAVSMYGDLSSWLSVTGDDSLDVLHTAFNEAAASLGIVGDQASELWDTIQFYADYYNLTPETIIKFCLSIMVFAAAKKIHAEDTIVGETAKEYVENTLAEWIEKFEIIDQESADEAIEDLEKAVDRNLEELSWLCPSCGEENIGNFCSNCGSARPEEVSWLCPSCRQENEGNFCSNCGAPRPGGVIRP